MSDYCELFFYYGVQVTGCLLMLSGMLAALAWSVCQLWKWLKVWHVLCLAVSIRLHGKGFADRQFWWAIQERASAGRWAAKNIADFAMKQAPENKP